MKYTIRGHGYTGVQYADTLTAARRLIIDMIKEDKHLYGAGSVNKLWQDGPVSSMQPGDWIRVHIGKNGYHVYSAYGISEATT
jgi:hypothetical protein